MAKKSKLKKILYILGILLLIFLIHRFIRPLTIYVVTDDFAYPIDPGTIPGELESISATECEQCHPEIFQEWKTSMHAQAWIDPYFQVDWDFDGRMQTCLNCHTPLINQQKNLVKGFTDPDRLKPVLEPNPNYDQSLRDEGVTCAVCHIKDGIIHGPHGITDAPHPTVKDKSFTDGWSVCKRCHLVKGDRWDMFYELPPCGTSDEITLGGKKINCPRCHMPETDWGAWPDGSKRIRKKHLFHGGHYLYMVKQALKTELVQEQRSNPKIKRFVLKLTNVGTDHMLPTGTPDRHLTVEFKLLNSDNIMVKQKTRKLIRTILWRPFIIDLWDTRIRPGETRIIPFKFRPDKNPMQLVVIVKYHLLEESRRKRIKFENKDPISYKVFQKVVKIQE